MKNGINDIVLVALVAPAVSILCLVCAQLPVAVSIGTAILAIGLLISLVSAKLYLGTSITPITIFFVGATTHAFFGYITSSTAESLIWIAGSTDQLFDTAFLIISIFIGTASIGYAIKLHVPLGISKKWISNLNIDEDKLFGLSKIFMLLGAAVMCGTYYHLGYLPILSDTPGQARFVRTVAGISSRALIDEWMINRALDLLTCSIPLVLLAALRNKTFWNWCFVAIGLATLQMPARRANILSVISIVVVIRLLQKRKLLRYVPALAVGFLILFASQRFFIDQTGRLSNWELAASAFPELRDLAWTVSLIGNRFLEGMTFLQAIMPIPSFLSDFYRQYSLREITNTLTGLKDLESSGGLRITLPGEAYLNFWYFGPLLIGIFFGIVCGYLDKALQLFKAKESTVGLYIGSIVTVWWCFWLYLGGTQASATIKMGSIIVFCLLYLGRRRQSVFGTSLPARHPAGEVRAAHS